MRRSGGYVHREIFSAFLLLCDGIEAGVSPGDQWGRLLRAPPRGEMFREIARGSQVSIMLLLVLAYFGGILTILSPCILPVLPFVFARSDEPFRKSGLPLLAGMVLTFAIVASLATIGGGMGRYERTSLAVWLR